MPPRPVEPPLQRPLPWNTAKDRFIAAQIRLIKSGDIGMQHFIDIQDYQPKQSTEFLNKLSAILEAL